jgi:hypothetical protein
MTEPAPHTQRAARRAKAPLTDADRTKVFDLAMKLLVDPETQHFKPNTFLTDANGDVRNQREPLAFELNAASGVREKVIRTPSDTIANKSWPALHALANDRELHPTPDAFAILSNFCIQNATQPADLFREKGHFMRQVVKLASRTRGEGRKALIDRAEASRIFDLIPLTSGRAR